MRLKKPNLKSLLKPFYRPSAPGTAPGTVIAVHEEPQPSIHVMAYNNQQLYDETVTSLDDLAELTETYEVTWINVDGLGNAEIIKQLGRMFGLHGLALEDVVNMHQRAKVEDYGDHLFIVAHMIEQETSLITEQICFFVGKKFLLTFQSGSPGDCLEQVRNRIRKSLGKIRQRSTDYLTYCLLDTIIDHYFPVVDSFSDRLDLLDNDIINNALRTSIVKTHAIRTELLAVRRTIRPHRDMIHELLKDSHDLITDETRIYLRDCYDHTIQLYDAIEMFRITSTEMRDFHLAAVNHQNNEATKMLTIIATFFIPLGFIASLYGMNFSYMPELHWKYGYPLVLCVMGGMITMLSYWFYRRGWFD